MGEEEKIKEVVTSIAKVYEEAKKTKEELEKEREAKK